MNLKLIEKQYNSRFVFSNTTFCEKTLYPIFRFTDTWDNKEYIVESSTDVLLENVLHNIIVDKRNTKIDKILK